MWFKQIFTSPFLRKWKEIREDLVFVIMVFVIRVIVDLEEENNIFNKKLVKGETSKPLFTELK